MAFGSGSSVIMPLKNEAGMPLNGFEVAQNVAEVLAYDSAIRYIGMAVYCMDEQAVYRFKTGVTDSDFVVDASATASTGMVISDNYSILPTSVTEQIAYCKNNYNDGLLDYPSGFYRYNLADSKWELISAKSTLDSDKSQDTEFIENVEINGVSEGIESLKVTQVVGKEETVIVTASQDSADGVTVKAGDIISITKTIDGIPVFTYSILEDEEELYNPFA